VQEPDTPFAPAWARRAFLGQLALMTAAFATTACAPSLSAPAPPAPAATPDPGAGLPPLPPLEFTDSWASRITGKYRGVFDSPSIDDGTAVFNAHTFMQGFEDMYGVSDWDVSAVVVIRHRAVPMVVDDTIWARYAIGEYAKVKDSATGKWATKNPFYKADPSDPDDAPYAMESLTKRGVIFLGCALATRGMAATLARRTNQKAGAVFDELRRHLVPGLELAPSGIFAVMRAQDAGCHYMRST
jgi:hypothetical protein